MAEIWTELEVIFIKQKPEAIETGSGSPLSYFLLSL
jgi:hypothetical protein